MAHHLSAELSRSPKLSAYMALRCGHLHINFNFNLPNVGATRDDDLFIVMGVLLTQSVSLAVKILERALGKTDILLRQVLKIKSILLRFWPCACDLELST